MERVSPGLIALSFLAKEPNRHRGGGRGLGPSRRTAGSALAVCAGAAVLAVVYYTLFRSDDARGSTDGGGNVDGSDDNACRGEPGGGCMKAKAIATAAATTTATGVSSSSSSSPSAVAAEAMVPNDSEVQAAIPQRVKDDDAGLDEVDEEGDMSSLNRPLSTFVDPVANPNTSSDEVTAGSEVATTVPVSPQSSGSGGGNGGFSSSVVANAGSSSGGARTVTGATGRLSKVRGWSLKHRRSSSCSSSSSSRAERRVANKERLDRSIQRHAERIQGAARSRQRLSEEWVGATTVSPPRTAAKEKRDMVRGNDEPAPWLSTRMRNGERAYSICGKSKDAPSFERHVADRAYFCSSSSSSSSSSHTAKSPIQISAKGGAAAHRHDSPLRLTMPNPPRLSTSERRGEKVYSSSTMRFGDADRSVSNWLAPRRGGCATGSVQKCGNGRRTVLFIESATNQTSSPSSLVQQGQPLHSSELGEDREELEGAALKTFFPARKQEKGRDQDSRIFVQTLDSLVCHGGHLQSEERYVQQRRETSEERKRGDDKKLAATVWHGSTPTRLIAEQLVSSQPFTTKRSDADPTDLLEVQPQCDDRHEHHESSVLRAKMAEGDLTMRE